MFFKKKEEKEFKEENIKDAKILILGSGCNKCNTLEENTKKAMKTLNLNEDVGHIRDFAEIVKFGVIATPALVIDGKVVSSAKVLSENELLEIFKKARNL